MSTSKKIEELISYSRILYDRKLLHATGGNTSVRDGNDVWISQTGAELGSLTEEQVVRVDLHGTIVDGQAPSKEMGMHLAMYRARPDAGAVIRLANGGEVLEFNPDFDLPADVAARDAFLLRAMGSVG